MEKSVFVRLMEKQLKTEYGNVAYWVNENTKGLALVFLHGLTADHTLFEKQISHFQEQYNILCWDAPAHGKSRPYTAFSYEKAARHLKDILEQEHIKEAVFVGQSMGGFVVQAFLEKYPTYVKAFIGIDTCPFGMQYYSKSDIWWLRQVEWMSRCYPYKALKKAMAKSCTYTEEAYHNMFTALDQYDKKELCHLMGVAYSAVLDEMCDLTISCPVLILVGEHDKTGKVQQYCKAWHENTGYPLHMIENAAHNSNYDNYEKVNHEIETFINAVQG